MVSTVSISGIHSTFSEKKVKYILKCMSTDPTYCAKKVSAF